MEEMHVLSITFAPYSGLVVLGLAAALLAFVVVSTLLVCTGRGALTALRAAGEGDPCEGGMRELELSDALEQEMEKAR